MKLELENGRTTTAPDDETITTALTSLRGFAILSQDEMTYMQTSGSAKDGFVLEYQDGDTECHFRCPAVLSLPQVTRAFLSYANGTDDWKAGFEWVSEEI